MNAPLHDTATPDGTHDPEAGARNLLENCVGVRPGERILIVREAPGLGHYDEAAAECVEREAAAMGCRPSAFDCPQVEGPEEVPQAL